MSAPLAAPPLPVIRPEREHARDHAVDMIKGLACLLMIVAHVPFPHAPWLNIATQGSVLFFASTGMNLWGLLERRRGDEARIAANALFLIFAGFANNYVQGTLWQADVFQSAGLAMLAMLALHLTLPRWWTWLFPLPFLLHYLNQHVYYWRVTDHGVGAFFLTPGLFPLLPWLSFYMLGAHLKRHPSATMRRPIAATVLVGLGLVVAMTGWHFDKFWMSTDYWLLGLAYPALLLDVLRVWLARRQSRPRHGTIPAAPWAEIRYWGGNSLVFYILHSLVLRTLQVWWPSGAFLLVLTVAGTAALLRAGLALQGWARRQPPAAVLAATAAVSLAVLLLEWRVFHDYYMRSFASFGLTLAFVAAYPAFKNLSARLPRRALVPDPSPQCDNSSTAS